MATVATDISQIQILQIKDDYWLQLINTPKHNVRKTASLCLDTAFKCF